MLLHYKRNVISRKHISVVIHNHSVNNIHNVQKTRSCTQWSRYTGNLSIINLNLISYTFYNQIGQWHWTLFIIHISDTSLKQKCLIRQVRTWLMASCFPDLSYLTSSFLGAGANVPWLSHMHPGICELIAYRLSTHRASPEISYLIFWPWNKRVLMFLKNLAVIRTCDKKQPHQKKRKIPLQHLFFLSLMFNMSSWGVDFAQPCKLIWRCGKTVPWAQEYKYVFPSIHPCEATWLQRSVTIFKWKSFQCKEN